MEENILEISFRFARKFDKNHHRYNPDHNINKWLSENEINCFYEIVIIKIPGKISIPLRQPILVFDTKEDRLLFELKWIDKY